MVFSSSGVPLSPVNAIRGRGASVDLFGRASGDTAGNKKKRPLHKTIKKRPTTVHGIAVSGNVKRFTKGRLMVELFLYLKDEITTHLAEHERKHIRKMLWVRSVTITQKAYFFVLMNKCAGSLPLDVNVRVAVWLEEHKDEVKRLASIMK